MHSLWSAEINVPKQIEESERPIDDIPESMMEKSLSKPTHKKNVDGQTTSPFTLTPAIPDTFLHTQPHSDNQPPKPILWVGPLTRIDSPASFLTKLPQYVGILLSPCEELSPEIWNILERQKHPIALMIPTRGRIDGEQHPPITLTPSPEALAYYNTLIASLKNRITALFVPHFSDVDRDVVDLLINMAQRNELTLVVPPQFFDYIPVVCNNRRVDYQVCDYWLPEYTPFQTFRICLLNTLTHFQKTGHLVAAVSLTDTNKADYFIEYINQLSKSEQNLETIVKKKL
jgi:hypothetical protein